MLPSRCHQFLPKSSRVYLYPPYYVKVRGLYRNFYRHEDHLAIAKLLQSRRFKRPWVVSYDNAAEICEMYSMSEGMSYALQGAEALSGQRSYVFQSRLVDRRRADTPSLNWQLDLLSQL